MQAIKLIKWRRYVGKIHTSRYILLPKEYMEAVGLAKDDAVDLIYIPEDGSLVLRPVPMEETE
jgi:bifunctional DNA-binding transcriptional regulator/antitoxin component of YhaV-PrlF toxin-antitoxin module